ncbi:MAG: acyl-CoA/acyl-ACP dehydrogenase [Desulfurococcales archaeon]|nr:acyl-CoA/acyl-ACP dehydrogenase [Desulfurococcales archaeon]
MEACRGLMARGALLEETFYPHDHETRLYRKSIIEWSTTHVEPNALRLDRMREEDVLEEARRIIKASSEVRMLSLIVPEDLGGAGALTYLGSNVLEILAYYDAGAATSIGAVWLGLLPVFTAGVLDGGESWKRWLKPFAESDEAGDPQVWAFAITEPTAGSDYERIEPGSKPEYVTVAVPDASGGYRVSGRKVFISNGPIADYVTVFAVADKSRPIESMLCLILERGEFKVETVYDKMGHRSSPTGELVFEDVSVPPERVLCPPGMGWEIAEITLSYSRAPVGAIGLGIAKRALEEAIVYAKSRVQGGRPIIEHQAVKMKIAGMIERAYLAENTVYNVAKLLEEKFPPPIEDSSVAKVAGADAAVYNALEAIQVYGGIGYMRETGIEKLLRDAKLVQIYEGTNEINRLTFTERFTSRI